MPTDLESVPALEYFQSRYGARGRYRAPLARAERAGQTVKESEKVLR